MASMSGGPHLNHMSKKILSCITTLSTRLQQKSTQLKSSQQQQIFLAISNAFLQGLYASSRQFSRYTQQIQAISRGRAQLRLKITSAQYKKLSHSFHTQLKSFNLPSSRMCSTQPRNSHAVPPSSPLNKSILKRYQQSNSVKRFVVQSQSKRSISTTSSAPLTSSVRSGLKSPRSRLLQRTTTTPKLPLQSTSKRSVTHTTTIQSHTKRTKPSVTTTSSRKLSTHRQKITNTASYQTVPYTISRRAYRFRFKRYYPAGRWSWFKFHTDVLSPVRTIFNWLRPLQFKLRRWRPGRFMGYLAILMTTLVYAWILILLLERNRQFDTGWTHPELVNFGYFMKRDWIHSNQMYDVEIYRKRRKFKKLDGNRFMHEEDLRVDEHEMPRWKWMIPDRFGTPRGVWPIRSYLINSPQHTDRKFLSSGVQEREALQTKWNNVFWRSFRQQWRRKRALRIRGAGKYEYGGTAHHYYFPAVHDEQHYMQVPESNYPAHILPDAAKY